MSGSIELSVVCPMFNEEGGILQFCESLKTHLETLGISYEVLLVDDGSTDNTVPLLLTVQWEQCTILQLSRNVGHQLALEAGVFESIGSTVLTMDADGQHPPDLIGEMYAEFCSNEVDVVYAVRTNKAGDNLFKRIPALGYYKFMRFLTDVPIQDRQADFRLVSRRVLMEIEHVHGQQVMRLLLPSIGFRSRIVEYEVRPRIAGKGHFGLSRQIRLATDSAFNFSSKPLRLVTAMGWILSIFSFIWLTAVLVTWLAQGAIEGWTSVMSAVLLVGGMSLLAMSIIGAYLARIYDIVKGRPRFFIDRKISLSRKLNNANTQTSEDEINLD